MFLLFSRDKRPDCDAILEFVACQANVAISHDPQDDVPSDIIGGQDAGDDHPGNTLTQLHNENLWVELVRDGLTFDLAGLAPGRGADFPSVWHRFDLERLPTEAQYEVLHLAPGRHLAGGERLLPVAMGLLGLARDIVDHFDELSGVIWPPSMSVIGHQFFESIITAWLEGGPFPALGLTAFRETIDGALQSEGLEYWIDQEIRIEPPISLDKVAATRLGIRLVNQLVLVGGVEGNERVVAPDGTKLTMRSSRNGKFVRVWPE